MKRLLLIINPKSGRPAGKAKLLDALELFSRNDIRTEVYISQKTGDVERYVAENGADFDIVASFGGDGTMNEVTNGLMKLKKKPLIGYFPTGTMNDFASNFELDGNIKKTAEKIAKMETKEFDVGVLEGRYFNYVAAFGALVAVSYETTRESKETLGSLAYVLEGLGRLSEITPFDLKVKFEGKEESFSALFGIIFNGYRVSGLEYLDKEEAPMDDGNFNILIVESTPSIIESTEYLNILTRGNSKYLHWYKGKEIELEFKEKVDWTLDGEKMDVSTSVKVQNINKALKLLC